MKWSRVVWQVGAAMAGVGAGALFAASAGVRGDAVWGTLTAVMIGDALAWISMTAAQALDAGECVALARVTLGAAALTGAAAALAWATTSPGGAAWPWPVLLPFASSVTAGCGALVSVHRLSATTDRARLFRNTATWLLVVGAGSVALLFAIASPPPLLRQAIPVAFLLSLVFAFHSRNMLLKIDLRRKRAKDEASADPAMAGEPCSVRCPKCDSRVQAAAGARSACACGVGVRVVALPRRPRFVLAVVGLGVLSLLAVAGGGIAETALREPQDMAGPEWTEWPQVLGAAMLAAAAASAPALVLWTWRGPHWLAALSTALNSLVSLLIALSELGAVPSFPEGRVRSAGFLVIVAAFWCLVLSRRRSASRLRRPAAIAGFAAAAAGAAVLAWLEGYRADDLAESGIAWVYACAALVGVAAWLACASAYEPSLERGPPESAPPANDAALNRKAAIRSACPGCGRERAAKRGSVQGCRRCRARWKIEIDEPQCKGCGYLLYGLGQGACPECGRTVEVRREQADAASEQIGAPLGVAGDAEGVG